MTSRNVLIIGGNGFLGQHAADALAEGAESIHIFDRPGSALEGGRSFVQHEGSVTDPRAVQEAVAVADPDTIVVLASYSHGDRGLGKAAEENPNGAVEVNVRGLLHVLEIAAGRPTTRLLWLSSTTVYGPAARYDSSSVTEDALVAPGSVYAATKVLGEQLIDSYRKVHGVKATAIRPTLIWGPGLRYRGVQSCLGDMVTAAVDGVEATVPDSTERWDVLYARDAGRAVAWLARTDVGPVVLVNGYRASVSDVRKAVLQEVPEARIHVAGAAPRLGLPAVDDRRIRDAGFVPQFDLEQSVHDYVRSLAVPAN